MAHALRARTGEGMPGQTTIQLAEQEAPILLAIIPMRLTSRAHAGEGMPGQTTIQLTEQEAAAIERLEALGFDRQACLVGNGNSGCVSLPRAPKCKVFTHACSALRDGSGHC